MAAESAKRDDVLDNRDDPVSAKPTVLLVDGHLRTLKTLQEKLIEAGFHVIAADSYHAAESALADNAVDLIVSEMRIMDADGIPFLRLVRQKEGYEQLPFIFLTRDRSQQSRLAARDEQADMYLVKPCVVDDLAARIRALIRRNAVVMKDARRRLGDLAGRLETLSLEEIMQILQRARKSGVLVVEFPNDTTPARIFWLNGEIHHAVYKRLEGTDAVVSLFSKREGRFYFIFSKPKVPRRTIRMPLQSLLLEGLRKLDETRRAGMRRKFEETPSEKRKRKTTRIPADMRDSKPSKVMRSTRCSVTTVALLAGRLTSGKIDGRLQFYNIQELQELFDSVENHTVYMTGARREHIANIVWLGDLKALVPLLMTLAPVFQPESIVRLLRSSMELTPVLIADVPGARMLRVIAVPFEEIRHVGRVVSEVLGVIVMPSEGAGSLAAWREDLVEWLARARPRTILPVGDADVEERVGELVSAADIDPDIVKRVDGISAEKIMIGVALARTISPMASGIEV